MTRAIAIGLVLWLVTLAPARADDDGDCIGLRDNAIAACTRLINSGKYGGTTLASYYGSRGIMLKLADQLDKAIADYTTAIQLNPNEARYYSNRANARRLKNDVDGALADLDMALRINPKQATVYVIRGLIYDESKNDPDRAIADYTMAIQIDPDFTSAFTYRGMAYEKKGDRVRAIADFKASLALPEKYTDGRWAHDTDRQRLAVLDPPPSTKPPVTRDPTLKF